MPDYAHPKRWKLLPILLLSPFMGSLDGSIVNVALPSIAKQLGTGMDGAQWIVSSYLIVVSALVLVCGKIADILGKARIFRWGFLVFGSGSMLCSFAWSLPVLIAARALQAVGAAMYMSSNQGIVATIFPPNERGRALGLMGTTVALGTMIGPPLGGVMVQFFGWQSLFLINIPISVFAFAASGGLVRDEGESRSRASPQAQSDGTPPAKPLAGFDLLGSILFALSIVSLFFYLLTGQGRGWLSPLELAALGTALLAGILFVMRERRLQDPMLDLSIFRSGLFTVSLICVVLVFCASFCVNIVQPFYLQDILKLSPAMAGLVILAAPLASGFVAPLGGYLADRLSAEALTVAGLVVELVALLLMCLLGSGSHPAFAAACLALFGAGQGAFGSPNTKLVMALAPRDKLGIAGSINALARNVGMVSGIAFAVSLLYGVMSARLGHKVSGFVPDRPEAFIAGMRAAFLAAAGLLAVAIALSSLRALRRGGK